MGLIRTFDKRVQAKNSKSSYNNMSSVSVFNDLKKTIKVLTSEQLKESRNPLYTYLF